MQNGQLTNDKFKFVSFEQLKLMNYIKYFQEYHQSLLLNKYSELKNDLQENFDNKEILKFLKNDGIFHYTELEGYNFQICELCFNHFICEKEITHLTCKHLFHKSCLANWVSENKQCPVCFTKIYNSDLSFMDLQNK